MYIHEIQSAKERGNYDNSLLCREIDDVDAFLAKRLSLERPESDREGEDPPATEVQCESGEDEDVDDDEALARRLFVDEQLAHQQRLLALAGEPPAARNILLR